MGELIHLPPPDQQAIDPDVEAIRGAVALVAAGTATRVTFVNFADPDQVLGAAVAIGQAAGVPVRPERGTGATAIVVGEPDTRRASPSR